MGFGSTLASLAVCCLLVWSLYVSIKNKPEMFSKVNIGRSFSTIGVLGIILLLVIGLAIKFLN